MKYHWIIWNLEWLVGEDLRRFSGIQPYRDMAAGDNKSLKF